MKRNPPQDPSKTLQGPRNPIFETNNPKAIRARMNFLSNLPNYKKNSKRKKLNSELLKAIQSSMKGLLPLW